MSDNRFGDWFQSFTGKKIYPLDFRPEDVDIQDIAHALGHLCRFNGHTRVFYSVAQHSCLCSHLVPANQALDALMHDASEAYLCDMVRPLKKFAAFNGIEGVTSFRDVEDRIMTTIAKKYGIHFPFTPEIHRADNVALVTEARDLMGVNALLAWNYADKPAPFEIIPLSPEESVELFLSRFSELS